MKDYCDATFYKEHPVSSLTPKPYSLCCIMMILRLPILWALKQVFTNLVS